ncbi:MAG: hypothetical protein ACJA1Q_003212, partial [Pseudohongiellaceae bacterium]
NLFPLYSAKKKALGMRAFKGSSSRIQSIWS